MDYSKFDHLEDSDEDTPPAAAPRETRWPNPQPYTIASGSGWNIRADASGSPATDVVKRVHDGALVNMIGEAGEFWILADGSGYALKSQNGIEWRKLSAKEADELESTERERLSKEAQEHAARLEARTRISIKPAHRSIGPQQLRAVIVPGTSDGRSDVRRGGWYGWLADRLRGHPAFGEVRIENMPGPMCTDVELWVDFMLQELRCDASTVVIGHSAGTASTMLLLQTHRLWGAVLVASCPGSVTGDAWPAIRANLGGNVAVIHGDDDAMTPLSNGELTARMLEAPLHMEPSVGHFNMRAEYPCIYDAAVRAAAAIPTHGCHKDGCCRRCCAGWWFRAQLKGSGGGYGRVRKHR